MQTTSTTQETETGKAETLKKIKAHCGLAQLWKNDRMQAWKVKQDTCKLEMRHILHKCLTNRTNYQEKQQLLHLSISSLQELMPFRKARFHQTQIISLHSNGSQ